MSISTVAWTFIIFVIPKSIQIHVVVISISLEVLVLAPQVMLLVGVFACGGLVKHTLEIDSAASWIVMNVCCDEVYVSWSLRHVILLLLVRQIRPM